MNQKKLSSGIAILYWDVKNSEYLYLLLKAYQYWDFPKGMVEKNETPLQAAKREVQEETAIEELDFRWGEIYKETGPYRAGKVARYYIAQVNSCDVSLLANPETGKPEHQDYKWFRFGEANSIVSPRVKSVLLWVNSIVSQPQDNS
ncbi:MAG: NUDIX domain-containing protein [Gammaproteobacteria bacterium]|nr:MAG: NUDIX domain-containing protein [Gammaproteobacteria bacterium]